MRRIDAGVLILIFIIGLLGAVACGDDEESAGDGSRVHIDSIDPTTGTTGTEIVITGSGFDASNNDVGFRLSESVGRYDVAYQTQITSPDGRTLRFELEGTLGACPESQTGGCEDIGLPLPAGEHAVAVYNRNGTSNEVTFTSH